MSLQNWVVTFWTPCNSKAKNQFEVKSIMIEPFFLTAGTLEPLIVLFSKYNLFTFL